MPAWGQNTIRKQVVFCGDRMVFWRKQRGMSQAVLAKLLDISRPQVANIENRVSEPSLSTLVGISQALGVTTDYLLGQSSDPGLEAMQFKLDDRHLPFDEQ